MPISDFITTLMWWICPCTKLIDFIKYFRLKPSKPCCIHIHLICLMSFVLLVKEVGLAFECTGLINKFELIYVCVCTLSSDIVALFMSVVCKVNEGGLSRLCWLF